MKHIYIIIWACLLLMTACTSNEIKQKQVTESNFNTEEAKIILQDTYEPIHRITNSKFETIPETKVKSYEEFVDTFNFSLVEENLIRSYIFETIVFIDEEGNPVKDGDGFLVYGAANMSPYIPTIYDEGVILKKAFIRDVDYGAEYSSLNVHELVIEENSDENIDEGASGFYRTNRFRKNAEGKWVLYRVEGTISYLR